MKEWKFINYKTLDKIAFATVINKDEFKEAFKNSNIVMFFATPISLAIAFVFAIILNSIKLKFSKHVLTTLIYSQFFISSFAIGASFVLLFGEKNIIGSLLNLNFTFIFGDKSIPVYYYYVIFQIWRSLPFNLVLFLFAFSRSDIKYLRLANHDKLRWYDKLYYYWPEIKNSLPNIIYTNLIFASLLYPYPIVGADKDLSSLSGNTIASIVLQYALTKEGVSSIPRPHLAGAASIIYISYLLFILLIVFFTIKIVKSIANKGLIWKAITKFGFCYKFIKLKINNSINKSRKMNG